MVSLQDSVSDLPVGVSLKDLSLDLTPLDCPVRQIHRTISLKPNGRFVTADVASGRYELRLTRLSDKINVTIGCEETWMEAE